MAGDDAVLCALELVEGCDEDVDEERRWRGRTARQGTTGFGGRIRQE